MNIDSEELLRINNRLKDIIYDLNLTKRKLTININQVNNNIKIENNYTLSKNSEVLSINLQEGINNAIVDLDNLNIFLKLQADAYKYSVQDSEEKLKKFVASIGGTLTLSTTNNVASTSTSGNNYLDFSSTQNSVNSTRQYIEKWEGEGTKCTYTDPTTGRNIDGRKAFKDGGTISAGAGVSNYCMEYIKSGISGASSDTMSEVEKNNLLATLKKDGGMAIGKCYPAFALESAKNSLVEIIYKRIEALGKKKGVELTPNQIASIASFSYNCGPDVEASSINAYIKGGNEGYWNYLKGHYYSSGKALSGLKDRRDSEYDLFAKGIDNGEYYGRKRTNY